MKPTIYRLFLISYQQIEETLFSHYLVAIQQFMDLLTLLTPPNTTTVLSLHY